MCFSNQYLEGIYQHNLQISPPKALKSSISSQLRYLCAVGWVRQQKRPSHPSLMSMSGTDKSLSYRKTTYNDKVMYVSQAAGSHVSRILYENQS